MLLKHRDDLFGFFIFHGVAFLENSRATVLAGPCGIGKSTVLRKIIKSNLATPLEDGFVFAAETEGRKIRLIETGFYQNNVPISLLSTILRDSLPFANPFFSQGIPEWKFNLFSRINTTISKFTTLLGRTVSKDRSDQAFRPRVFDIERLVFVAHEKDFWPSIYVDQDCQVRELVGKAAVGSLSILDVDLFVRTPWNDWQNDVMAH